MYEHAIPQNIMDFEFRLFAGLTVKQFVYLAVSGGFSYGLYQLTVQGAFPPLFAWIIIPPTVIIGIALSLGSFQSRPLEDWVTNFYRSFNQPIRRVWRKGPKSISYDSFFSSKPQSFPQTLAVYLLSEDEYKKLIQKFNTNNPTAVTAPLPVAPTLVVTPQNVADFADTNISLPPVPNTVAFRIMQDGIPTEGIVAYMQAPDNRIVSALRSNEAGILYFNQSVPNGTYSFEFQSETDTFPRVQLTFEGTTYPLINLAPLE